MSLPILFEDEMLFRGLELVGFDEKRQKNVQLKKNMSRFCTHCSANLIVHACLWSRLIESLAFQITAMVNSVGIEKAICY